MFAYINIYHPKSKYIELNTLLKNLKYKGWGNPEKNFFYSPWDVINNPKKYKDEMERIEKSNLKYPIIISGNNIIDGVHRLAKSYLNNKKQIKTYIFSNA